MIRYYCCLLLLMQWVKVDAQNSGTRVTGTVYAKNQLGNYIHVYLLENADTLQRFSTNTTGSFNFNPVFCDGNEYRLEISNNCGSFAVPINITGFATMLTREIQFDSITMLKCCTLSSPMANVYKINSINSIETFDLQKLKVILDEYPGMQIRFFQCASPDDRKRVIKNRMKTFQELVISNGINPSQVLFPEHPEIPDSYVSDSTFFNKLPHISAAVVCL